MPPSASSLPTPKMREWNPQTWLRLREHLDWQAPRMISWLPDGYLKEDLVSDTIERLWKYKCDDTFDSWDDIQRFATRSMRNHLITLVRTQKKTSEHLFRYFIENLDQSVADTSQSDSDMRLAIEQAFQRLSEKDREAIFLRYVLGWKQNEIAKKWGVSDQAVSARLKKIRNKLLSILEIE